MKKLSLTHSVTLSITVAAIISMSSVLLAQDDEIEAYLAVVQRTKLMIKEALPPKPSKISAQKLLNELEKMPLDKAGEVDLSGEVDVNSRMLAQEWFTTLLPTADELRAQPGNNLEEKLKKLGESKLKKAIWDPIKNAGGIKNWITQRLNRIKNKQAKNLALKLTTYVLSVNPEDHSKKMIDPDSLPEEEKNILVSFLIQIDLYFNYLSDIVSGK